MKLALILCLLLAGCATRTTRAPQGSLPMAVVIPVAQQTKAAFFYLGGLDVEVTQVLNTNSMLPTFDSNAVLLLEKCRFEDLGEGDIVTYFIDPKKWGSAAMDYTRTIHRLNERVGAGHWPLGDNNGRMDPELVTKANFDRRLIGILFAKKENDTDK